MSTKLEDLLDERKIDQKELAKEIGWAYTTVNNFVAGRTKPSDELVAALSNNLKIPQGDLRLMVQERPNTRPADRIQETPAPLLDPESVAFDRIVNELGKLDPVTRKRVLDFVSRRVAESGPDGSLKYPKD